MVDVGGYRLAAEVMGEAGPAVVFVSAFGEPRDSWSSVLPLLNEPMRKVSYDRAGIGESEPRPDRGTPQPYSAMARELDQLLSTLEVAGPYVLVGHSFGCLVARAFEVIWPDRVVGLVLVDGSVPELALSADRESALRYDGDESTATRVDRLGGAAELATRRQRAPILAVVLTKTPGNWKSYPITPEVDAYWQQTQREVADEFDAVQIIAIDAGHRLNDDTPELVAMAVDAVVRAARQRQPVTLDSAKMEKAGGRITRT
jgi:pimeloyl-ACP methyl ester carboxylesterase